MRITKVYTRTGDQGMTRLVGGQQVPKDDVRIHAYGTTDELNCIVGIVRMELGRGAWTDAGRDDLNRQLEQIQNDLFNLGSDLATRSEDRWEGMRLLNAADVERLENQIDAMNDDLPPLEEFILPGGGPSSAFLHQARTVCRRSERLAITLAGVEDINPQTVKYLNRLSDWLFVAGRWASAQAGESEVLWDRTQ
jgi:cob(I)alamin adenosyltransferase